MTAHADGSAVADAPPPPASFGARALDVCRTSPVPYLVVLVIGAMAGFHLNYLGGVLETDALVVKGQSPAIYLPILLFPVVVVLWLLYRGRPASRLGLVYLGLLAFAWVVHLGLVLAHADQHIHSIWLYLPTLGLIAFKAPSRQEAWTVVVAIAWAAAGLIVLTRVLEIAGWVPMFKIPDLLATEWEKQHYWLPLSGHLGLNGRWPGPFGFNSKTGFFSVLILVIAVQQWRRSSWLLGAVGVLGIVLTGGRGPYLSAFVGISLLVLFSERIPVVRRIPAALKVAAVAAGGILLAAYFAFFTEASVTGRGDIWGGFLDVWQQSPWTGVSQVTILQSPGIVGAAMDAHSMLIQELTSYGVIGFVAQYAPILFGLGIATVAAARGWAGPLAVTAIYLVASVTDVLHMGWVAHSTYTLMLILVTLSAAQPATAPETTRSDER